MGAAPATVRPMQAVDLEQLVGWAIGAQRADQSSSSLFDAELSAHYGLLYDLPADRAVHARGHSTDGVVAIARKGTIGTDIDGSGVTRGVVARVHPDAEAVADAIEQVHPSQRPLILFHARQGGRPEWLPTLQPLVAARRPGEKRGRYQTLTEYRWEPALKRSELAARYLQRGGRLVDPYGKSRIEAEEAGFQFRVHRDGTREVKVRWSVVEPQHSPRDVAEANGDYRSWHAGMLELLALLPPLRDHVVTGFAAPARPWDCNP